MTASRDMALLARLEAEHAIRDVLHRYCRAVDRCDADLLTSCYHADAHDDHGTYKGGRDGFVEYSLTALRERHRTHGQITTHQLGNVLIDFDDDGASVESYFSAAHVEDRETGFRVFAFHGRYLDRFQQRDGEWRISSRTVVHDWSEIREGRRGLIPGRHDYVQGSLAPDDPVSTWSTSPTYRVPNGR